MASSLHNQDLDKSVSRLFRRLRGFPAQTYTLGECATSDNCQLRPHHDYRHTLPPLPFDGNGTITPRPETQSNSTSNTEQSTSPLLLLPGEIRNLIYDHAFSPGLNSSTLPHTHRLPHGVNLLLTCRQVHLEAHQYLHLGTLVYALHTPRTNFYDQLPAKSLRLMNSIYLPASNIGNTSLKYADWAKGTYDCVIEKLCVSGFHPTTLVFTTDSRIGGFEQRGTDSRCARYASALLDLRFALSILKTLKRIYVVDIGAPVALATRDYFAELFARCFPLDKEKVGELQHELLSNIRSPTRYHYAGLAYYNDIPGSEMEWDLQEPEAEPTEDEDFDFLLGTTDNDGVPRPQMQVYTFSNWTDFCRAYRGPMHPPERSGEPTTEGEETSFVVQQDCDVRWNV